MNVRVIKGNLLLLFMLLSLAFPATQIVSAGGTLNLSADLTLASSDTLQVNGTSQNPCTITGNGHQIKAGSGNWSGQIRLTYCTVNQLGTSANNGISLISTSSAATIIENCIFSQCGGFDLNTGGTSTVSFKGNTILENSVVVVDKALEASHDQFNARGNSTSPKYFQGNKIFRAHVNISGPNWLIGGDRPEQSNILIGMRVRIDASGSGTVVRGNYLHLLMPIDTVYPYWSQVHTLTSTGGALCEHNIIRDGEWIVQFVEGEFRYNIICDIADHNLIRTGSYGRIHHNIFLVGRPHHRQGEMGPMIAVYGGGNYAGPGVEVFNNTFDGSKFFFSPGMEMIPPGYCLNLRNNVFFNMAQKAKNVVDSSAVISPERMEVWDTITNWVRLGYTDYNCFYNPLSVRKDNYALKVAGGLRERLDAGFGKHDLPPGGAINAQVDPRFTGPVLDTFAFNDSDIITGKVTMPQMLAYYWEVYKPAAGSPLIGAGDPADGNGTDIGAVQVSAVNTKVGKLMAEDGKMQLNVIPNPAMGMLSFTVTGPKGRESEIMVFKLSGQRVAALVGNPDASGKSLIFWNTRDIPNGTYIVQCRAGGIISSKRFVLQ